MQDPPHGGRGEAQWQELQLQKVGSLKKTHHSGSPRTWWWSWSWWSWWRWSWSWQWWWCSPFKCRRSSLSTLRKAPGASEERRQKDRSSWKYENVYGEHDHDDRNYNVKGKDKDNGNGDEIPGLAGASERMPQVGWMGWGCARASTPSGSTCSGTGETGLRWSSWRRGPPVEIQIQSRSQIHVLTTIQI